MYFQSKQVSDAMAVVALTTQIFILCFFANETQANSGKLMTQLYKSNWIQLIGARGSGRQFQKMMLIFMKCTQSEVSFYLGRIFPLNLETFAKVRYTVW